MRQLSSETPAHYTCTAGKTLTDRKRGKPKMRRCKVDRILILALMLAATSMLTTAQVASKPAYVTIIAIMPETLTLSINVSSPAYSVSATSAMDKPGVAAGVTTAWSLLPGRDKVATFATMNHVSTPVIIASALPIGVDPLPDGRSEGIPAPRGYAVRPSVSSTQMTGMSLTDTNRRGASAAALPDSTDPTQLLQSPANAPSRILRIQVQPVL
jgi:hypothetical protein